MLRHTSTCLGYKHLRTLARLLLVQPELRHLLSDLGLLAAEVLDRTASTTLTDARTTMGQVRSTTGTFQNVVGRALAASKQAQSAVGEETLHSLSSAHGVKGAMVDLAKGAQKGMPVLAELKTQLKDTADNGLPSMHVLDEELGNVQAVPALQELRARVEAAAGGLGDGAVAEPQAEARALEESTIASQTATLVPSEAAAAGRESSASIKQQSAPVEDLAPTDLLDAAQMAAVAQPGTHLVDQRKVAQILKQAGSDAKENAKDSWTEERQEKLKRRLRKVSCVQSWQGERLADTLRSPSSPWIARATRTIGKLSFGSSVAWRHWPRLLRTI